jgi:transcriptional regulator with XRE-family HTH domain
MIKRLRIRRGFTQMELAAGLNTDRQYISKIENGKINMSLDYLDKVLKQLGSNPKDFFLQLNNVTKK